MISWREHMRCRLSVWLLLGAGCAAFSGNFVQAQESIGNAPTPPNEALPPNLPPSIASSIPVLAQFKKELLHLGYNLQLNYAGDVLGNPTGGVKQGATYEGLLQMAVDGDLDRIAGLSGATFHVNAYVIHGRGLSKNNIFNFLTITDIEALATTRLYEAWFEQALFGGMASLRIGQLGADTEFFISDFGALYFNATFGWPNIWAADLPSTGPNYPLATPGIRLKVTPNDQTTLLAALFNGDTSGAGFTGLQEILDPAGINFRLRDPPFLVAEVQYKYNQDTSSAGPAGTARLGAWYQFGSFADQRFGTDRLSLADPLSIGTPLNHRGDYGVYGIIDQMVWHLPGNDPKRGAGVFARVSASPSDRNVVDFYADGGINFSGLWDKRPGDIFGLAAAYSPVSPSVSGLDSDKVFFAKTPLPIRDYEMALELTYQAQILPGFLVQPDFQFIFHPRNGAIDPINPAIGRIPDAAVLGIRTAIKF
jgi:porin